MKIPTFLLNIHICKFIPIKTKAKSILNGLKFIQSVNDVIRYVGRTPVYDKANNSTLSEAMCSVVLSMRHRRVAGRPAGGHSSTRRGRRGSPLPAATVPRQAILSALY